MKETIGNRIQKFRKDKSLTQEALAEQLGVSPQAVSKWENDSSCPDITLLPQLCRILGVTTDELLSGKSELVTFVPPEQRKNIEELILRIRVNSADCDTVRVNLPMPLVKIGIELGMVNIPGITGDVGNILQNVDLNKLLAMVEQGLIGKLVEVESADGDIVEIVVE